MSCWVGRWLLLPCSSSSSNNWLLLLQHEAAASAACSPQREGSPLGSPDSGAPLGLQQIVLQMIKLLHPRTIQQQLLLLLLLLLLLQEVQQQVLSASLARVLLPV